jgi:hypothetical protein
LDGPTTPVRLGKLAQRSLNKTDGVPDVDQAARATRHHTDEVASYRTRRPPVKLTDDLLQQAPATHALANDSIISAIVNSIA